MFGNQLWYLVMQSDAVCKFVLLILLAMSVLCWTIFFGKLIIFRIKNKHFTSAYKKMLLVKNVPELIVYTNDLINTAPGYLLAKNLTYLHELTAHTPDQALHKYDWELLEKHCESSIETMILHNESYLSILSSCAAVAPLLGLFGTVWGLVHSFISISETQVANITTIAPGIAEALITTLAGLIIAIPALIMFNYLQTHIRHLEHSMLIFVDKMISIMQQLRGK